MSIQTRGLRTAVEGVRGVAMRAAHKFLVAALLLPAVSAPIRASDALPAATVEDAVRMVRIQYNVAADDSVAAISPNGRLAAIVTWRGDIERNLNVYTLRIFDLRQSASGPLPFREVMSRDFKGDQEDQVASPFSHLKFLGDNRTLAYLGRDENTIQVYTVDTLTGKSRQLTHHPSSVRSFVVGADGSLKAFSAVAFASEGKGKSRLEEDGVFMWDPDLFPVRLKYFSSVPLLAWKKGDRQIRQYFLAGTGQPKLIFDSRWSRPSKPLDLNDPKVAGGTTESLEDDNILKGLSSLTVDPKEKYTLLFPYALTDHSMDVEKYAYYAKQDPVVKRWSAPYGLVDMETGKIQPLVDAPHPMFERYESGEPVWMPDGGSVVIYTLSPDAPAAAPQWMEVDIATRRMTPLRLPENWRPIAWNAGKHALVLSGKDGRFGVLPRNRTKGWEKFSEIGVVEGFNQAWPVAVDGDKVIGVKDASLIPPEIAMYDFGSKRTQVLSDLNPSLHRLRYGQVELLHWPSKFDPDATGFLIKPVDFKPGTRYPLVVLQDDNTMRREGEPYLLDASWQLSGHAIQMLAAQGFMVLYTREPKLKDVIQTMEEGEHVRDNIESAIAYLDRAGLIDPARVGLSGWSRAAYYTDYVLMHSSFPFAAASSIDGGAVEYNEGMRPFTDEELKRIQTPKLFEAHALFTLVYMGTMADRMAAMGKPTEILYFDTASHSTTRPQHRLRSLETHMDWWRFWLKGEEDPNPIKAAQYSHWRELLELKKSSRDASPAQPS